MYGEAKTVLEDDSNAKEAELLLKLPSDGKRTTGLRAHLKNFGRKGDDFGVDVGGVGADAGEEADALWPDPLQDPPFFASLVAAHMPLVQPLASAMLEAIGADDVAAAPRRGPAAADARVGPPARKVRRRDAGALSRAAAASHLQR